jgi:[ribosomal protein S5]-alanine N-acetyltransferase
MAIDERLIFHEGKHIRMKVLDESDILESGWVGWFNDETLCEFNQHHYFPNTFANQRELLSAYQGPGKLQLGVIDRAAPSQICGVVSLSAIDFLHRRAEIGGIQASTATRINPAIFVESYAFMLRHGFEQLGLRRIYGGTFHPHVSGALQRIFGFEVEGKMKGHVFKHGEYHDVTLVAVCSESVSYPVL